MGNVSMSDMESVGKMRLIHFTIVIWLGRVNCLIISETFFPSFLYTYGQAPLFMCEKKRLKE